MFGSPANLEEYGTFVYEYPVSDEVENTEDTIDLGILTKETNATMVKLESTDNGDFIEIKLVPLSLMFLYNSLIVMSNFSKCLLLKKKKRKSEEKNKKCID